LINEEYYKLKGELTGNQNKKQFVYELIPSDNYEKNNKKTFSVNPEINLIDTLKIEEILKDNRIPIQEKVKNFDIQFETNIEEFRTVKNENTYFLQQFQKFYNNGDLVEFEPFKTNNPQVNQIQKMMDKQIFDEIILAYEKKNYKVPDFVKKNLFEISPMLVDLKSMKDYYNVQQRLEEPNLICDIQKMITMSNILGSKGNMKNFIPYTENDFTLNNVAKGNQFADLKLSNFESIKNNSKFKKFVEIQAEQLKKILNTNEFLNSIKEENNQFKEIENQNFSSINILH